MAARALAAVLLATTAAASFVAEIDKPPNSTAALFAKDLLAVRAHGASMAHTLLPDKKAAALSKPRLLGYPQGVCNADCDDNQNCPGRTCTQGPCPSFTYADARASRDFTPCLSSFPSTCADPANADCPSCVLWNEIEYRCAPTGVSPIGCVSRGDYVIIRSRDVTDVGGGVLKLCATRHYLLLPTRACTGVESDNPLCTGSKAEYWWGAAFDEAVLYGIAPGLLGFKAPPPPPNGTLRIWGRDVPVAPGTPTWGVAINAPNRRSQHQTHIRIGAWKAGVDEGEDYWHDYGGIVPAWLAVESFSVDALHPTLTGPAAPIVVSPGLVQWPQLATVFVPTPLAGKPDAYRADVWATASKVAAAVSRGADRPYGILIAPRWQAALGPGLGGPVVPGVTVTAVYDIGAGQILDEPVDLGDCVGLCELWRPVNATAVGARPPPLKSWAAAKAGASDAEASDCEVPPKPADFPGSQREWYEYLGLSW